ncbi:hypothetical protein BGZ96_009354 [Linnemannia gamsii]|uniref:F-box protein n=1 Tax=Linnemannia gamsii TaxID=64522 RepID=A0ABQ7JWL5_9FUNG|nr:hypothetical protein BGZ96_009354 [Linnemannia gamsii]
MTSSQLLLLLAEVLLHVGEHLDRRTLYAAIQTSTHLNTTYTPLLWRTITLDDTSVHPIRFEALQSRAEHVCDLTLKTFLPSQSLPTKDFWNAVYSEWLQPRSLTVQELNVTERVAGAFWKACSRFEVLHLSFHAPSASLPKDLVFPLVTHLDLKLDHQRTEPFSAEEQLSFIKSCPSLTSLCWSLDHFDSPMLQFQEALTHKTWTQLVEIEFKGLVHLDAEMAAVMDSLHPLKNLILSQCSFGPLTFSRLKERHFATLEVLNVIGCEGFTSPMAMEVLSRSLRLQEFSCPHIRPKDLVQCSQEQQQQQPFACQSQLRHLDLFISKDDTDPVDWTIQAMERLSTLNQLKYLSLCPTRRVFGCRDQALNQAHETSSKRGNALDMSLANGLGRLSSLNKMSYLEFGDSSPRMGVQEAQWMAQYWKQLKSVNLSSDNNRPPAGL